MAPWRRTLGLIAPKSASDHEEAQLAVPERELVRLGRAAVTAFPDKPAGLAEHAVFHCGFRLPRKAATPSCRDLDSAVARAWAGDEGPKVQFMDSAGLLQMGFTACQP